MKHVVIDTNALIQILGAHSKYRHLWSDFLAGKYTLCVSNEIMFEYEEMLKEKGSARAADMFVKVISYSTNVVKKDPHYRLNLIEADEDDNKFVDCAFACQAEYIVSDDSHFKILNTIPFPKIIVKKLDEFDKEDFLPQE